MKKLTKFVLSVFTGAMMLGMTAFASEFSVTDVSAILYTTAEAELLADTDMTAVVLDKNTMPDGAPILVTGITNNGYFRVDLNGTYYIAGNGLVEGNAGVVVGTGSAEAVTPVATPVQNTGKYVCVIEEGDKELFESKTVHNWGSANRMDYTNDEYYIYFRDQMETAYAKGEKSTRIELGVAYKPMAELMRNLSVDFIKAHPDIDDVFFGAKCPTASLKNPFLGHEFAYYHIAYYIE